jgi:hypothetical protein
VPRPPTSREEIQNQGIRDSEIEPADYYPEGYHPELLTEWPIDDDPVVPVEQLPPALLHSMGEAWRQRKAYRKHISELSADGESSVD